LIEKRRDGRAGRGVILQFSYSLSRSAIQLI
jgi:hypothetical protein